MTDRPHCLNRGDCKAAKPTSHCRSCVAKRLNSDPELVAKRRAATAAHHADPSIKAGYRERMAKMSAQAWADPAYVERTRERGRITASTVLRRPDVIEKARDPGVRAKANASREETLLGWCPVERRDEYRELNRSKRIPAAEARAIIEAEIEGTREHARRAIDSAKLAMRLKHEREKREAY